MIRVPGLAPSACPIALERRRGLAPLSPASLSRPCRAHAEREKEAWPRCRVSCGPVVVFRCRVFLCRARREKKRSGHVVWPRCPGPFWAGGRRRGPAPLLCCAFSLSSVRERGWTPGASFGRTPSTRLRSSHQLTEDSIPGRPGSVALRSGAECGGRRSKARR